MQHFLKSNYEPVSLFFFETYVFSPLSTQSIVPLVESLKLLSGPDTCIICCYEQRTEGVNPKVERQFFEVRTKLCVPFVSTRHKQILIS